MEYKSLIFIRNILEKKFTLPDHGKIIQYGVKYPAGLSRLATVYGSDRVIGYEIDEEICHTNIVHFDLTNIGSDQDCDIAFCDIDVGCFATHSDLRLKLMLWSSSRMVQHGLIMINSPMVTDNVWQESGHDYMIRNNFKCHRFTQYINESWYQKMLQDKEWNPATTCLYEKL